MSNLLDREQAMLEKVMKHQGICLDSPEAMSIRALFVRTKASGSLHIDDKRYLCELLPCLADRLAKFFSYSSVGQFAGHDYTVAWGTLIDRLEALYKEGPLLDYNQCTKETLVEFAKVFGSTPISAAKAFAKVQAEARVKPQAEHDKELCDYLRLFLGKSTTDATPLPDHVQEHIRKAINASRKCPF